MGRELLQEADGVWRDGVEYGGGVTEAAVLSQRLNEQDEAWTNFLGDMDTLKLQLHSTSCEQRPSRAERLLPLKEETS